MALKTNTTINGLGVQDAYVRVDRLFGGKREGWTAVVGVYASEGAAADGTAPLTTFNHSTPYEDGANPYNALYWALSEEVYPESVDA